MLWTESNRDQYSLAIELKPAVQLASVRICGQAATIITERPNHVIKKKNKTKKNMFKASSLCA